MNSIQAIRGAIKVVREHVCPWCKMQGKIYIPQEPKSTEIICPYCKALEDVAYIQKETESLEDIERREYERLKAKYGG